MFLGGEFLDYAELANIFPVSREMATVSCDARGGDWSRSHRDGNHVCLVRQFGHRGAPEGRALNLIRYRDV